MDIKSSNIAKIKLKFGPNGPSVPGVQPKKARRGRPPAKARQFKDETTGYPREEHCILRMPPNDPLTAKLREIVKKRKEYPADFELNWKDGRHGLVRFEGETLLAKLVDLPCIIESQKTFDRRQFHKVADICQMIVVERPPPPSPSNPDPIQTFLSRPPTNDECIENSGITPPLKHCRIRRFRKRVNKRTLESIEREVMRLLREDQRAEKVETVFVDPSELDDRIAADADEDEDVNVEDYDDDEGTQTRQNSDDESSVDSEFAAELEDEISRAMEEVSDEEEEEEEEEQEGGEFDIVLEDAEEEEEDEEMDQELRILLDQQKILREEMKDLEDKINEKNQQKSKAMNSIIQKRFDDIIKKLESERELKVSQMTELELKIEDTRQTAEELAEEAAKAAAAAANGEVNDDQDDAADGQNEEDSQQT